MKVAGDNTEPGQALLLQDLDSIKKWLIFLSSSAVSGIFSHQALGIGPASECIAREGSIFLA
jgi:hypothetical protein